MKKYLIAIASGFIAYLAATALYPLFSEICYSFYVILRGFIPSLPLYSSVLEKEKYQLLMGTINAIATLPSLTVATFAVARFQNKRYESITAETNGLYTLREGLEFYFPRYLVADIIGALAPVAVFCTAYHLIPDVIIKKYISALFAFTAAPVGLIGAIPSATLFTLAFLACVPLKAIYSTLAWRASWLSEGSLS